MGFSLKKVLQKVVKPLARTALAVYAPGVSAVYEAGRTLRAPTMAQPLAARYMTDTGEPVYDEGGMVQTGAPMAIAAIGAVVYKLARTLGIALQPTLGSVARVGGRIYQSLAAFAARHPGVSLLSLLTGLGLSADEAAQFIGWGATRRRKRRARGISAKDFRTTRRTVRKIVRMTQDLRALGGAPRGARRLPAHQHQIVSR